MLWMPYIRKDAQKGIKCLKYTRCTKGTITIRGQRIDIRERFKRQKIDGERTKK